MKVRKHKRDESLHFYIVKRKKPSTHLMILHSKPPFSYSPPSTPSINPLFHFRPDRRGVEILKKLAKLPRQILQIFKFGDGCEFHIF